MSMLSVPFVPFPSLLSSSSASPSRSTPTVQTRTRSRWLPSSAPASHWRESGRLTDSAPNTGYEPNFADVSRNIASEFGIPLALSGSRKAAASKVSFLFGHTCSRETGVGHVSSRSSHQETEADLDRESVATTIIISESRGKRDRELNFVHAWIDRDDLQKIFERELTRPFRERKRLNKNCIMLKWRLTRRIGRSEIWIILFRRSIKNFNLSDFD